MERAICIAGILEPDYTVAEGRSYARRLYEAGLLSREDLSVVESLVEN